jgi:predicted anti-sigma-YlaC factor YlaD
MVKKRGFVAAGALVCFVLLGSCAVLGAASKAEDVFMSEEDPELAAGALPTFIKASEMLLAADPTNRDKAVTTASLYVMYANAFVDGPASYLPDERFEERKAAADRAGALYRRAFRLLAAALERRSPGIVEAAKAGNAAALGRLKRADVPLLYWSAASVLAAFGLNPLDFESAGNLGAAGPFLARAAELDPGWNDGAIYEVYLPYYASLPPYMGGDREKALDAYEKALGYSKGRSASLFVAYATSICVPADDYSGYRAALERALAIDAQSRPEARLATVVAQKRARWLLETADRYFDISEEGGN